MIKTRSGISTLVLGVLSSTLLITACASMNVKRSRDGSLEAPPPEDSPVAAVVNEPSKVVPQFPLIDPSRWSSTDVSKTGVVFAWSIAGSSRLVSESGCRLRVRHRESGDTALLKLDAKTPVSIQDLKPGTWDAKRLGCGLTRVWDLEGLFRDGFVVKNESISVIGWFVFEFDDHTLLRVREGGRQENTNLAMQLRGGWSGASTLISGFSGKAIPAKLESRDEVVRVKATGLKNSDQLLQPLLARFQSCASQGMKVDPLRAGTLKIEATYKAGVFTGARTLSQENALRDDLLQCIRDAHEKFELAGAGDFTLETTY
jgi:hypothetical protein